VSAVTTKPVDPLVQIEHAQATLAQAAAPIAQLEAARLELDHVIAAGEAELAEIASRRTIETTALTPAIELNKKLDAIERREKEVCRRIEIAKTVLGALETRIATDREAERADKQRAAYDEAIKLRVVAAKRVREFLGRFGPESRKVMREYAESEMKSAAANQDLPPGAAPIPSIEVARKGELRRPKLTVREFAAFIDGRRFVAEQHHVQAAERADGKWDVFLPGGTTGGGDYFVCSISNYVEIVSETDATPWPENLAKCLSVPSFFVSERSWWDPVDDHLPAAVADALSRLEAHPPHHFEPRVSTRVMPLAAWREMNGETIEADPPRAMAAE
jgi:hypothetical protein